MSEFVFETEYRGQSIRLVATMQADGSKVYADCDHFVNGEFRGGHGRNTMVEACKVALAFAKARVDLMLARQQATPATLLQFNQAVKRELEARAS